MRILAIADQETYGFKGIEDAHEKMGSVSRNADLVVGLGDLELFHLKFLAPDIPKIGVYGNHCSGNYMEEIGMRNLHLKTFRLRGVTFGGHEGSWRYKERGDFLYTEEEVFENLKDFPRVDVFIAHNPLQETGINDGIHNGFEAFSVYIKEKEPFLFLHGHTEYPQEVKIGKTIVKCILGLELIEFSALPGLIRFEPIRD